MRTSTRAALLPLVAIISMTTSSCGGGGAERDTVATPSVSAPAATFGVPMLVSLSSATTGASLFYTLDGTPATSGSIPYDGPFTIVDTTTVNAIATHADMNDSAGASATFTHDPVTLALDDGSAEQYMGSMSTSAQVLWLVQFTPPADRYPFTLRQVSVLFGPGTTVDGPMELLIYADADGNPANGAVQVASQEVTVQAADWPEMTWSVYELAPPVVLTGPGDVLIGVANRISVGTEWWIGQDLSGGSGRVWYGAWNGSPGDPPPFPPPSFQSFSGFNLTIRGSN